MGMKLLYNHPILAHNRSDMNESIIYMSHVGWDDDKEKTNT